MKLSPEVPGGWRQRHLGCDRKAAGSRFCARPSFLDPRHPPRFRRCLTIPVALGEQEFSQWRFQYTIRERVADIVQPDLFYYGGLIRSIRVARMAALRDMPASPHLSGGFGFVYLLHFASCVPKIGPWQEYKEGVRQYGDWFNPPLRILDGALHVPQGPGVGITDSKEVLKGA